MKIDMVMPKLGESIAEATVIKWLKQPGDAVEADGVVLEISTDKVDSEIPSTHSGYLSKILVQEGETVEVGTVIAEIVTDQSELEGGSDSGEAQASTPPAESVETAEEKQPEPAAPVEESIAEESSEGRFYSPLVRSIARKEGISIEQLDSITGSGAGGRVTKNDLMNYLESGDVSAAEPEAAVVEPKTIEPVSEPAAEAAPEPEPIAAKEPEPVSPVSEDEEIIPMDRMRKAIAEHMVSSVKTSPHVFIFTSVDMKNIVDFREDVKNAFFKKENFKLTYTPFIVRAVARALKEFPYLNASVNGDNIVLKKAINIGIAVALEKGLIVPVLKNADKLDLLETARAVNTLSTNARTKKLMPDDVQGGTFSVTNMGVFGSLAGFPIINQPQVGILGVGAIDKQPVVVNDAITIRPIMYLTIGFDHRIVDGADGAKFLERVSSILSEFDPMTGI
ncbi:MAG: 2-oxo acid dehydrogenase subunit E2 [Candidatus Marinimicrobia bacterium]|nr:2-oxo acid dehydrogenase subunit E2 [Candidatus Neomarinimicrobiota bacterium]